MNELRELLRAHDLRVTAPRLAVLGVLDRAHGPLSHREVLENLGQTAWDPATIYRNLIKLRDAGVAPVVSRAEGIDRYAFAKHGDDDHHHPHFVCEHCGRVSCLPAELLASMSMDGVWCESIRTATVHLRGTCPTCRQCDGEEDVVHCSHHRQGHP